MPQKLPFHPLTLAAFCLFFVALACTLPHFAARYGLLVVYLMIASSARVLKSYLKFLTGLFFLVFFVFLIQILFADGSTILWQTKYLTVTQESLLKAANLTSLILGIASAVFLFFKVVDVPEFVVALEKKGFNRQAAFLVLSTLQIIPLMSKQSTVIMNAQKARGVETEGGFITRTKAFLPILFPLIKSALTSTTEKALTLEARGFSSHLPKTFINEESDTRIEQLIRLFIYIAIVLMIALRGVMLWLI